MNIWVKSIIVGLVIAAAYFFFYDQLKGKKETNYFKVSYNVKISNETGSALLMEDVVNKAQSVLNRRLDKLGYPFSIKRAGAESLNISLENVDDTSATRQMITTKGKLEIREVYTLGQLAGTFAPLINRINEKFFAKPQVTPGKDSSKGAFDLPDPPAQSDIHSVIRFSIDNSGIPGTAWIGTVKKSDTSVINKIFSDAEILGMLPGDIRFKYGLVEKWAKKKEGPDVFNLYSLRTKMQESELRNEHIVSAEQSFNAAGQPEVRFDFNQTGSRIWERMTRENVGRPLAIIIDENVISAPHVNSAISGGSSSVSGGFTIDEARLLAHQLGAGLLAADVAIKSQEIVSQVVVDRRKIVITVLSFLFTGGLAFFIFYTLKRNQI